jgi:hypothetical protein
LFRELTNTEEYAKLIQLTENTEVSHQIAQVVATNNDETTFTGFYWRQYFLNKIKSFFEKPPETLENAPKSAETLENAPKLEEAQQTKKKWYQWFGGKKSRKIRKKQKKTMNRRLKTPNRRLKRRMHHFTKKGNRRVTSSFSTANSGIGHF